MVMLVSVLSAFASARAAEPERYSAEQKNHWAWKPVANVEPPAVSDTKWVRTPIDRFVLAKLERANLAPANPATKEQLIRRVSFDLNGLPPTTDEIDAFLKDNSPQAWERVVDRLLASPHYGERWGRHWLDLARYADSNGYEFDEVRPDAWRYRDYVVESFNADKPYSQFIREQLAGDEGNRDQPSARIATGFNLLGPDMTDSSDQVQRRQNTLNDMTDTAGLAFLGLTVGCARCHDHKFEPISQKDYYRLQAFFTSATFRTDLNIAPADKRKELAESFATYERNRKPIQDALSELEGPHRGKLRNAKLAKQSEEVREAHETPEAKRTPAQRERVAETIRFVAVSTAEVLKEMTAEDRTRHVELTAKLRAIDATKPKIPVAMGLENAKAPVTSYLLERGEPSQRGEPVQAGFPRILSSADPAIGNRTALTQWLTNEANPLTARVIVNRIWQHHFGRGIVATPSDFGMRGTAPTHPELLDWLAREFQRHGGSVKTIHKTILMSATYGQSSLASPDVLTADPDNRLFSRMNRQRLEGEVVRDSLLAISQRLDLKRGGPGDKPGSTRRSIYLFARRNLRNPFLEAFDLPDSNLSCPKRERSTTAPQALALLNDAEVVAASKAMAELLRNDPAPIDAVYRRVLGRLPTANESKIATEFLKQSPLGELCRALFNVNEFVYVD